ncbi:MAG: S66 peptidase family protein, partial [Chloroflexota bacterium]
MHKPQRLRPGGLIGVLAPAGTVDPRAIQAGVDAIRACGFEVELSSNLFASDGYLAGKARARAQDLLEFFHRPDIDAIFCARGGFGSVQLLPYLSTELSNHAKIFVGYSDITTLLNWLCQSCQMVTFHAPMVATDIARGLSDRDKAHLWHLLDGTMGDWQLALGETIRPGRVEAEMIGGCLSILVTSLGTQHE